MNKKDINLNLNQEKSKNNTLNIDNFLDKNYKLNIKNNLVISNTVNFNYNKDNYKYIDKIINNEKNIIKNPDFKISKHKEIKNIKHQKSICNMIILHSGNIAISSSGTVIIYDSNNLLSSNENEYLLQKINISKNEEVSYVFEFPDETLLCSIYGKIFHFKLIEKERNYHILGIINLDKDETTSKFISLGDSFLAILTLMKGCSFIRLFVKEKESDNNNKLINKYNYNYNDQFNNNIKQINNNDNYNFDEQCKGIFNDNFIYLDKKDIEKDSAFYPYSEDNNLNLDKKFLCTIYEIKNNNNYENKNIIEYKFIATSNSTYYGCEDKLEFYDVKKILNQNIEFKTSKIIDISSDSICQLNKKFLCIGLKNYFNIWPKNGFAIIDIEQKKISRIIRNSPIDSLYFNFEKKLLYSAIEIIENNDKHNYLIEINLLLTLNIIYS